MRLFLLGFLSLSLATHLIGADPIKTTTIDDVPSYILKGDIKRSGIHDLPFCFSEFTLPAERFMIIRNQNGHHDIVISKNDFSDEVVMDSTNCGFSWIEDFEQINSEEHFEEILRKTSTLNISLLKQGLDELVVQDYLQKPTVDKKRNIMFYAVEFTQGGKTFVNSVAYKLGRKGFVTFIWITDLEHYIPCGGELDVALRAHRFHEGYRYEDYQMGDLLAFHPFTYLFNQLYLFSWNL